MPRCLVPLVIALLLASCVFQEQKDYAANTALKHLHARQAGRLDEAFQYYGEEMFKDTPRAVWRQALENIQSKLGAPASFELASWNTAERMMTNGTSGALVTLTYNVTYEHATGTETFVLFRARGSDDVAIIGHNVSSLALVK